MILITSLHFHHTTVFDSLHSTVSRFLFSILFFYSLFLKWGLELHGARTVVVHVFYSKINSNKKKISSVHLSVGSFYRRLWRMEKSSFNTLLAYSSDSTGNRFSNSIGIWNLLTCFYFNSRIPIKIRE